MTSGLGPIIAEAWRAAEPHFAAVEHYPYHHPGHTQEVFHRAMELCDAEDVDERTRLELGIATIFHDTGYARAYANNEPIGAAFAREFLLKQGWGEEAIGRVESLILCTVLGAEAPSLAHTIIQDSDLDILGREDGVASTFDLYQEIVRFSNLPDSWMQWLERSTRLFRTHEFRTSRARLERSAKQKENLATMEMILAREERMVRHSSLGH